VTYFTIVATVGPVKRTGLISQGHDHDCFGSQNANRLSQKRKTTYATAKIGMRQLGGRRCHIGLEGYADGATPQCARRLSDRGLSCLRNEAYDVKRALDAGQRPGEKELGKWQWVAGFGKVSCQFKMR